MGNLNQKQIAGFILAFLLVIFGFVAMLLNKDDQIWGWFLGSGIISFCITLMPKLN